MVLDDDNSMIYMSLFSPLCLLDIVLVWQREILSSSLVGVKKRYSRNDKHYVHGLLMHLSRAFLSLFKKPHYIYRISN